jgi:hypothetical protein
MALSRKERRALQYLREQAGLPPAKPWEYELARTERLRENALLRELMVLVTKHGFTLDKVRELVTEVRDQPETV